jgi:non-canonical (house-cleaning) NTP pyrophosphatase
MQHPSKLNELVSQLNAVEVAFRASFPKDTTFEFMSVNVPSGVSDQPIGDQETLQGAVNRAQACVPQLTVAPADDEAGKVAVARMPKRLFTVGVEGGVRKVDTGAITFEKETPTWEGQDLECFAW